MKIVFLLNYPSSSSLNNNLDIKSYCIDYKSLEDKNCVLSPLKKVLIPEIQ